MIGKSHLAMAAALAACASGIGGFFYGTSMGRAAEVAAQKRADDAADAVRQQLQGQIDAAAIAAQNKEYQRQASVREIHNETIKIIDRPVYRNVCIDADGVRLLDHAATVANGAGGTPPVGTATDTAHGPARP
ncbi:hypothetical protein [Sphingopyxis yananensis]|uniref:hypothetical protein n=1 Tax=Sphingopyxis yananensis TaxID=2886687 RepID=UPI001D0F5557|nr:hypothetical protein [Sphingopyxis yananensis]MCC2603015.1 hypothetical protein [Sphingopyxis yananensis]